MINKYIYITILALSIPLSIFSQNQHNIEFKINIGEIAPHRINFPSLTDKQIYGFELNYLFHRQYNSYYNDAYNFPIRGYGINSTNLRNKEVLGNAFAIYTFIEFKIIENNYIIFNIRPYAGIAYLTNKYDPILNPRNIAIGSDINFYGNLNINARYQLSNTLNIMFGGGLIHFSNGSARKPNLGLNQLYLNFGISKHLYTSASKMEKVDLFDKYKPYEFWLMGAIFGADEYSKGYNGRGKLSLCTSFSTGYNYQYSGLGKIGISLDLFYNDNFKYYYHPENNSLKRNEFNTLEVTQIGTSFGHHLIYRKFEFINFIGIYNYNKTNPKERFYMRIGWRYYFTDNFFANMSLKFIGFKAQYIEPGIGYSIRSKNYKYVQTRATASGR